MHVLHPSETNKMVMICVNFLYAIPYKYILSCLFALQLVSNVQLRIKPFFNFEICMIYAIFIIYHFFTGLWQNVATIWGKYIVFPPISFSMSVTHFHMSTTTVIYLFIHSAACSSYACCRRESYINKCKTKLLLMQNSIFLPYLLSLNRDLCVTISSV